ncbi:MAG: M56 family metallopeptidase [Erysipelotrichaceae bacterium]
MNDLFLNVFTISVLSSFLIVAVIIIRTLFKKLSKNYICLLWGLTALRLMTTFSIKTEIGIVRNTSYIRRDIYNTIVYPSIVYTDNKINLISILSFIWITGMMLFIAYFIYSYLSLKRNLNNSYKLKDNIYLADKYNSPFVFGLFNPKIYIPFYTEDDDIDNIILHENMHIKRKDNIFKTLAFILLSIYWFNPLVYIAYKLFSRDLEMACDEMTVKNMNTDEKEKYALSLLNCAHKNNLNATVSSFAENSIRERIERIIKKTKVNRSCIISFLTVSLITIVAFFTSKINIEHYLVPMKDATICLDQYAYEHHDGVDYAGEDNIVLASMSGTVVERDDYSLIIKHDNDEYTLYSNMEEIDVDINDEVIQSQIIGTSTSLSSFDDCHVHFSILNQNRKCEYNIVDKVTCLEE